jgi:hypothetical protein
MLRDKNLVPLSRQHQHALALCVRIDRASPVAESDLAVWRAEIVQIFQSEIGQHFAAEEEFLFPAARKFAKLLPLVEELLVEHQTLRECFACAEAGQLSTSGLTEFARQLSEHIRKEERQLFESLQEVMPAGELALVGKKLDEALVGAGESCILPTKETRLRPAK